MANSEIIDKAIFQYNHLLRSELNYKFVLSRHAYEELIAFNREIIVSNKDSFTTLLGKEIKVINTPGMLVAVEIIF